MPALDRIVAALIVGVGLYAAACGGPVAPVREEVPTEQPPPAPAEQPSADAPPFVSADWRASQYTPDPARVVSPDLGPSDGDPGCPMGMKHVAAPGEVVLGEDDPQRVFDCACDPNTVLEATWTLERDYCIATWPFPGKGYRVPTRDPEGHLAYGEVKRIAAILPRYGRRLCSFKEVLFAAAGRENRRFPWGDEWRDVCDSYKEPVGTIGAWPECVTPEGVFELGVRSTWATLDAQAERHLEAGYDVGLDPGDLAVTGLSSEQRAGLAALTNYGIHCHVNACGTYDRGVEGGLDWSDDALRVCADPGPADPAKDAAWAALRARFAEVEDYAVFWTEPG